MTKEERHKYYKEALEDIVEKNLAPFICTRLNGVSGVSYDLIPHEFPEFGKFKPKKPLSDGTTKWWLDNKEGREKRIEVLKECIKLTKPKSNGISKRGGSTKRKSLHPVSKRTRGKLAVVRRVRKKSKTR